MATTIAGQAGEEAVRAPARFASLTLLKWLAVLLVAVKLVLLAAGGTFMDEAYYWMWGQHPALSYYDHPPLNAWLQGISGAIFGWNRLGLRLMVVLALAGDMVLLYLLARRLAPQDPALHFWPTLVLFLATPMFFAVTAAALPDHLLVLGVLAALYCFVTFFQRWQQAPRTAWGYLYLGAICLGLAALSKYNAVFLGLGLALFILGSSRFRPLLRSPRLYLAAALSFVVQAPVLLWNLQQDWASFGFILGGRHAGFSAGPAGGIGWLLGLALFISPFLLPSLVQFLFSRRDDAGERLARVAFLLSTLAILGISFVTPTLFHWNLVAYLVALPFLVFHFRWRWLYWAQIAYGTLFLALVTVNYSVVPLTDVNAIRDEASAWAYGWEGTAEAVAAARDAHGAAFVATSDYTTASLLGYAMGDPAVTSLSARVEQYDFWFDAAAHAGEDAILFGDDWRPLDAGVQARFESVELLEERPVSQLGKPLNVHRIYLGRGFTP
jgi:4-amino-4-deoxy-L-arabinose transferase-like glycosyltransferase